MPLAVVRPRHLYGIALLIMATLQALACGSTSSNTTAAPSPAKCAVTVNGPNAAFPATGGAGTVTVAAARECSWTAAAQADWIALAQPTDGRGDATLNFTVKANGAGTPRSGGISISGHMVNVAQEAAPCRFTLQPNPLDLAAAEGTGDVSVQAPAGCAWTAAANVSWLTIAEGTSGMGGGRVRVHASANTAASSRDGAVTIAGTRVTVTQAGTASQPPVPTPTPTPTPEPEPEPSPTPTPTPPPTPTPTPTPGPCTFDLAPSTAGVGAAGGAGTASLHTGDECDWKASTDAGWLTLTTATNGTGPATIGWEAAPNTSTSPRTAHVKVGDASVAVTQDAAVQTCDFTVKPTEFSIDAGGGSHDIDVHTSKDCTWTAESAVAWITVASGATGKGNGTVGLRIDANADSSARTGTVRIAGVDVVVQQAAAQPVTLAGDVEALSGTCPTVTFAVDQQSVYTSLATMYVGGSCQKLKKHQRVMTLGLPRNGGGLDALSVTFDANVLP